MDTLRRTLLKAAGASGALGAALVTGIFVPTRAWAAEWNKAAFEAKEIAGALKGVGASSVAEHKDILLKAPDIAENGAVVPIDVVSNIPNTTEISIMVSKNPNPLSTVFSFANGAVPEASVRLKLAETSIVKTVVKADGKFYTTQKEVKVTVGGCGG